MLISKTVLCCNKAIVFTFRYFQIQVGFVQTNGIGNKESFKRLGHRDDISELHIEGVTAMTLHYDVNLNWRDKVGDAQDKELLKGRKNIYKVRQEKLVF